MTKKLAAFYHLTYLMRGNRAKHFNLSLGMCFNFNGINPLARTQNKLEFYFTIGAPQLVPDVVGQFDDGLAGAGYPEVRPGGEVVLVNRVQHLVL